jgi:hypothetical protein
MGTWWNDNRKGLIVAGSVVAALVVVPQVLSLLGDDASGMAGGALLWLVLAVGYIVPSIVASVRSHHNLGAIIAVNVLLGWTFIGWVVALVWALADPAPAVAQVSAPVQYQVGDVVNGHRFNGRTWEQLH